MKFQANPVIVDAYKITKVLPVEDGGERWLELDNGSRVFATLDMMSRMTPCVGDYWVVQEDGYAYLNPASVFERKYSLVKE